MASDFFAAQMDYVFFLYGLSYLLLAVICLPLRRHSLQPIRWEWMFLFAGVSCIVSWIDLLQTARGTHPYLADMQLVLKGAGFACLVEFGRASLNRMSRKRTAAWIHAPLLFAALFTVVFSTESTGTVVRYTFGLIGCLWGAAVLFRAAGAARTENDSLFSAGVFLLLLGVAEGLVAPPAPFFPASFINTDTVFAWTQIPIHIVRCGLVIGFAICVWRYYLYAMRVAWAKAAGSVKAPHAWNLVIALFFVLGAGAILTQYAGKLADENIRATMVKQSRFAANAIDWRRVSRFSVTPEDVGTPDYVYLREQLAQMAASDSDLRWIYTVCLKEGRIVFLVDSIPEDAFGFELPGAAYEQPPPRLFELFQSGQCGTVGPYTDEYGSFVSSFAPVMDPNSGAVLAMVGLDIEASQWKTAVAHARLAAIVLVLFLCVLRVSFFLTRHSEWMTMQRVALSEDRLLEAQRLAHVGHWTYVSATKSVAWSEELFRILGMSPGSPVPAYSDLLQRIHPEDRNRWEAVFRGRSRADRDMRIELRVLREDGDIRHVCVIIQAHRDIQGSVAWHTGTAQDITEQKRAQAEILSWKRRYDTLTVASGQIVYERNLQTNHVEWGGSLEQVTGYTPEELKGSLALWENLIHDDDRDTTRRMLDAAIGQEGYLNAQYRFRRKDGTRIWIHDRGYVVLNPVENVPCILGVMEDITDRKESEQVLRENEERFRLLYADAPDPILILDERGAFADCNNAALAIFDVPEKNELRANFIIRHSPKHQPGGIASSEQAALTIRQALMAGSHQFEWTHCRRDGTEFVVDVSLGVVHVRGEVRLLAYLRDITEKKIAEARLREMSILDELTGLHNRRGFLALAEQQLKLAYRLHQTAMLVYIDLDRLKGINDALGHEIGDQAIQDVATVLRKSFRASDVVGRIGGDEFVGLALESEKGAGKTVLRRILENLRQHNATSNRSYTLEFSMGHAVYDPDAPCALADLLKQGDARMYEQKQKRHARRDF